MEFRAHLDTGSGIEDTGEWVRDEVVLARVLGLGLTLTLTKHIQVIYCQNADKR